MTPEEFLAPTTIGLATLARVRAVLAPYGDVEERTTRSQVAFRRRRGFAFLWRPGLYLRRPTAEVVLSIALDHELDSPRLKEVAHPSPRVWQHHLELHTPDDLDDEVAAWLVEACEAAGPSPA